MKTLARTLIAVAGIVLLSVQLNTVTAGGTPTGTQQITYVVNIIPSQSRLGNFHMVAYVGITDGSNSNRLIVPPQQVKPGIWTYYFHETGPVKGTRIAFLYQDPNFPSDYQLNCPPDPESGNFAPGGSYVFDLYPTVKYLPRIGIKPGS